jgi:methionine-gamma-lyase
MPPSAVPLSLPLIQASIFAFGSPEEMIDVLKGRKQGFVYSRYENPTVIAVPEQMRHFGGVLAVDLRGGADAAQAFPRGLRIMKLATTLGGSETLASHPATSSHRMLIELERRSLGLHERRARTSLALEDEEDLLGDAEGALRSSGSGSRE